MRLYRRTLQSDLVALQALHGALEERVVAASLARDVVLVKLDRDVDVLEDLLDRVGELGADAVTRDEGNLRRARADATVSTGSSSADRQAFTSGEENSRRPEIGLDAQCRRRRTWSDPREQAVRQRCGHHSRTGQRSCDTFQPVRPVDAGPAVDVDRAGQAGGQGGR